MSGKDKDWLLLKKADGAALRATRRADRALSAVGPLRAHRRGDGATRRAARRDPRAPRRARARRAARWSRARQPFMLATLAERPFSEPDWLFEIKYDGVRVLAARRRRRASSSTAGAARTITGRYPEVVRALRALPVDALRHRRRDRGARRRAAGRASSGCSRAWRLTDPRDDRARDGARSARSSGVFFDCLDARRPRPAPAAARRRARSACGSWCRRSASVRYGDHVVGAGHGLPRGGRRAAARGHRGQAGARARTPAARSRDWIKIKCQRRQEFVIGGYTDPQGSRGHFGALHLGLYDGGAPRLRLQGRHRLRRRRSSSAIWEKLRPLARADVAVRRRRDPDGPRPPLGRAAARRRGALHRLDATTAASATRRSSACATTSAPRTAGARTAGRSSPASPAPIAAERRGGERASARAATPRRRRGGAAEARSSSPISKKVFWPAEGYTKGDLVALLRARSRR